MKVAWPSISAGGPREVLAILGSVAHELALGKDLRAALPPGGAFHPLTEVLGVEAVRAALVGLLDDRLPWLRWTGPPPDPPVPLEVQEEGPEPQPEEHIDDQ